MSKASVTSDLVRRERELSGLDVLLDPDLFCALAEARGDGRTLSGGRLLRLRYQPGERAVGVYAFDGPRGTEVLHARALRRGEAGRPSAHDGAGVDDAVWPEGLAVCCFPRDEGLPSLASLVHDGGLRDLLGSESGEPDGVHTVAYSPCCWWVGRVDVEGRPVASLKVLEARAFESAFWNLRALASGDLLRLPEVLGTSRASSALTCAWCHGRTLRSALGDPGLDSVMLEAAGAALGELHAQDAAALAHCTRASETLAVRELATTLTHLVPTVGPHVLALADRLSRRLLEVRTAGAPVHGDPSPDRLLLQGDRVALLDVDRACRGEPARDLGALLAHLDAMALEGRLPTAVAERAGATVMAGYRRVARRPPSRRDVQLYRACALLRLALEPFRRLDEEWPSAAVDRVRRAGAVLEAAGGPARRTAAPHRTSRNAG